MKKLTLFSVCAAITLAVMSLPAFGGELYAVEGDPVFSVGGESYYVRSCSIDANGDGKLTASDARKILRVSAKIDSFSGAVG